MTEVVTGEAVVLDVPPARFPSRIVALIIDLVIQVVLLFAVLVAVLVSMGTIEQAEAAGISVTCYVLIVVGYSTIFETLTRGRTPGKMALGLRVVSDDGGPVRFRQALVRALTAVVEVWLIIGAPFGLVVSIVSVKGKRIGDVFAGTYVIQERAPRRRELPPMFASVPPPLMGWAQVAEVSRLMDQTAEAAGSYLRRFWELTPAARDELGARIATAMLSQVSPPPPPGTPATAFLAAVLAVRRDREQLRLQGPLPTTAPPLSPSTAPTPAPAAADPPTAAGPTRDGAVPVAGPPTPGEWAAPGTADGSWAAPDSLQVASGARPAGGAEVRPSPGTAAAAPGSAAEDPPGVGFAPPG